MFQWLQLITWVFAVDRLLVITSAYCEGSSGSCPNGVEIEYPFYLESFRSDSEEYCGYPELAIKCAQDGRPIINISNHFFYYMESYIESVYFDNDTYQSHYFSVVDVDIDGQACPHPRHNFSLKSAPTLDMWYDGFSVTIFYNCTKAPEYAVQHLPCLNKHSKSNNNTRLSYAFLKDDIPNEFNWYDNCEENVVVPVSASSSLLQSNYTQALKYGVDLAWSPPTQCKNCEESGGQCWSNKTTSGFLCLCAERTVLFDKICYATTRPSLLTGVLKVIIAVSTGLGGLLLSLFLLYKRIFHSMYNINISHLGKKTEGPTNVEVFLENYGCLALQRYTYADVKKITNSFKNTIGQGGYGSVYKGKLHDGRLVAVKVLNESKGKGEDFINEVAAIGRTNHVNVVSLVGFCTEGTKRALVYEFMPNGSLENFIYNTKNSSTESLLGSENLFQIALGIARGLEYLHRGCNTRILHLDIKPHNILLDQDFCPKISDFGLAKLCPTRESIVSMVGARGTIGYIAPEVCCRNFGGVSHKSDVYSYGMMVLEMIGGRKNIDATIENISEVYFPQWIYNRLKQDIKLEGHEDNQTKVSMKIFEDQMTKKMTMVALWCIQAHPADRPSMSKVVEMLEGNIEELQMCPNPFPNPSSTYSPSTS